MGVLCDGGRGGKHTVQCWWGYLWGVQSRGVVARPGAAHRVFGLWLLGS